MTITLPDLDIQQFATEHPDVLLLCGAIGVSVLALTVWTQRGRLSRVKLGPIGLEFNPN